MQLPREVVYASGALCVRSMGDAHHTDLNHLAQIFQQTCEAHLSNGLGRAFGSTRFEDYRRYLLQANPHLVVAYNPEGHPLGFATITQYEYGLEIGVLVSDAHTRQGVGKALMTYVQNFVPGKKILNVEGGNLQAVIFFNSVLEYNFKNFDGQTHTYIQESPPATADAPSPPCDGTTSAPVEASRKKILKFNNWIVQKLELKPTSNGTQSTAATPSETSQTGDSFDPCPPTMTGE
ncbi:MAG: GNAT family N-acetyltransferase [Alphaproteobacteria bacterium]|nr:GNAT family N-acetyltransferase [Alphaproteobacteria bacterium]